MDGFLSPDQHRILGAMDIPVWLSRETDQSAFEASAIAPAEIDPGATEEGRGPVAAWNSLEQEVAGCTQCALHRSRTRTVFGVGDPGAEWMIIGEAPGADEDRRGEPFVGKAGQLLNEMLRAAGFERGEVFIANILKCRPPNNRDPEPEEVAACADYLNRQVEMIRPRLILAVGRIAAQNLLQLDQPVGRLRGVVHRYGSFDIPLVVTYHPAYLLRSPSQKRKAWADLCLARSVTEHPES